MANILSVIDAGNKIIKSISKNNLYKLEVELPHKHGGIQLNNWCYTYHYINGKLIAVKEYGNSVSELSNYSHNNLKGSLLRFDWKEAGYKRPLKKIEAGGCIWIQWSASQDDLKSGGAVYLEKNFFEANKKVLDRKPTYEFAVKLTKVGKKSGYTGEELELMFYEALDSYTISEKKYSDADAAYKKLLSSCFDLVSRKQNAEELEKLADASAAAKKDLDKIKQNLVDIKALFYRKQIMSKWTTQKRIQSKALAITPSKPFIEIGLDNTIILPAHTRKDNVGNNVVRKLSTKEGHMSAEKVDEVSFSGPDGMFIISKEYVEAAYKAGKINKEDYESVMAEGCIQARGDNPDNDGYFALKGLGVLADGHMGERDVLDFRGTVRHYKPGMNLLTADTIKDWFLYNSAEEFFAQKRRIRIMSHNWEAGKVETGRQTMQGLHQANIGQLRSLLEDAVKTLKSTKTPQGYKEVIEKRIRAMVPDLSDAEYDVIQSLWMHPAMNMNQVKATWCKVQSILASKVKVAGCSAPVAANVKWFFEACVYGLDSKTCGDLKPSEVKVPKGWAPIGAVGAAIRYPYTAPKYYMVKVVGYTEGNYIEVSMQESELIMPHLSMDFDGDHMGIIFEAAYVEAAMASNEVAEMLGATYLVYDDNKGEEWIGCCDEIEYIEAAPDLGSAGIATAPLFLLCSLIPNAKLYEKKYGEAMTTNSKIQINDKLVFLVKKEGRNNYPMWVRELKSEDEVSNVDEAVTVGEVMQMICYISADVTWQVDAVKRAAKSPFADTEEGLRMKALCKDLYAASQWHDHPFQEKAIALRDRADDNKRMIAMNSLSVIDRICVETRKQIGCPIKNDLLEYNQVKEGEAESVELVLNPSRHKATEWRATPWRAVLYSTGSEQANKFIATFDTTGKSYENTEVYCGESLGFRKYEEVKDMIFGDFELRDANYAEDDKYDKLNVSFTKRGEGVEVGVFVTRLLRVMLRWNNRNSDPRKKKDVTEAAYDVGRMLCHICYYKKYGEKLTDKQADIMLYRMFAHFLFGAKPYDTVGDELMHVLNYYTAREIDGVENEHAYLRWQLHIFVRDGMTYYDDLKKNEEYVKWLTRKRVVITKEEHAAEAAAAK